MSFEGWLIVAGRISDALILLSYWRPEAPERYKQIASKCFKDVLGRPGGAVLGKVDVPNLEGGHILFHRERAQGFIVAVLVVGDASAKCPTALQERAAVELNKIKLRMDHRRNKALPAVADVQEKFRYNQCLYSDCKEALQLINRQERQDAKIHGSSSPASASTQPFTPAARRQQQTQASANRKGAVGQVEDKVNETKNNLAQAIQTVTNNAGQMEDLERGTDQLAKNAELYRNNAAAVKDAMGKRYQRMKVIGIASAVTLTLYGIIALCDVLDVF